MYKEGYCKCEDSVEILGDVRGISTSIQINRLVPKYKILAAGDKMVAPR